MHTIIKNIARSLAIAILCPILMGAVDTLGPDPYFQNKTYDFTQGQTIQPGAFALPVLTGPDQTGLFISSEGSVDYIEITNISPSAPPGLGLTFDQQPKNDRFHPLASRFVIYGTIPATYPSGTYPVTITARNFVTGTMSVPPQLIYLRIGTGPSTNPPFPVGTVPQQNGLVGQSENLNMSSYFNVAPGSPAIDQYNIQGTLPDGLSLNNSTISGIYSSKSVSPNPYHVSVKAHNSVGWSDPQPVTFVVNDLPFPTQDSLSVTGNVGDKVNIPNMSQYFSVLPGASPINEYRLDPTTPLPSNSGVIFDADGQFGGDYSLKSTYAVKVEAHNSVGWSVKSLTVTFNIGTFSKTITCPTEQAIQNEPASVPSPTDPNSIFNKVEFDGASMIRFLDAELQSNSNFPHGLACRYQATNPGLILYVLDQVPTGTYFGDDPTKTIYTCRNERENCQFHVP